MLCQICTHGHMNPKGNILSRYSHIYVCVHMCVCMFVCVYIYVCECVYKKLILVAVFRIHMGTGLRKRKKIEQNNP